MNWPSHTTAAVLLIGSALGAAKTKKSGTVPGGLGDGAGNHREAPVRRIPPDERVGHDRDGMPLAPVFADEDGAGLETPVEFRFVAAGESIEQLDGCPIQSTECLLLKPVGDHPRDQVLSESTRRDGSECHPPLLAKLIDAEGADALDLSLDGCPFGWLHLRRPGVRCRRSSA